MTHQPSNTQEAFMFVSICSVVRQRRVTKPVFSLIRGVTLPQRHSSSSSLLFFFTGVLNRVKYVRSADTVLSVRAKPQRHHGIRGHRLFGPFFRNFERALNSASSEQEHSVHADITNNLRQFEVYRHDTPTSF